MLGNPACLNAIMERAWQARGRRAPAQALPRWRRIQVRSFVVTCLPPCLREHRPAPVPLLRPCVRAHYLSDAEPRGSPCCAACIGCLSIERGLRSSSSPLASRDPDTRHCNTNSALSTLTPLSPSALRPIHRWLGPSHSRCLSGLVFLFLPPLCNA